MLIEGYETYDIKWAGELGWQTDKFGHGLKNLMCAYATLVRSIATDLADNPEVMGATGNSGGATFEGFTSFLTTIFEEAWLGLLPWNFARNCSLLLQRFLEHQTRTGSGGNRMPMQSRARGNVARRDGSAVTRCYSDNRA